MPCDECEIVVSSGVCKQCRTDLQETLFSRDPRCRLDGSLQLRAGSGRLQRRCRAVHRRIRSGRGGEKKQRQNAQNDKKARLVDDPVAHSFVKNIPLDAAPFNQGLHVGSGAIGNGEIPYLRPSWVFHDHGSSETGVLAAALKPLGQKSALTHAASGSGQQPQ